MQTSVRSSSGHGKVVQPSRRVPPSCHPLHRRIPDQVSARRTAVHKDPFAHRHQSDHEERQEPPRVHQDVC